MPQATYLLIVFIIRHVYDSNSNSYFNWILTMCQAKIYTYTHTYFIYPCKNTMRKALFHRWWNWDWMWQHFRLDLFDSRAQICFMYLLHFLALPPWIFYSIQTNSSYMCLFPIFLSIPFAPRTSNSGNVFHTHFFLNFTNLSENSLITTSSMRPFLNLQPK